MRTARRGAFGCLFLFVLWIGLLIFYGAFRHRGALEGVAGWVVFIVLVFGIVGWIQDVRGVLKG